MLNVELEVVMKRLVDLLFKPFRLVRKYLSHWVFYGLMIITGIGGVWFTYNYAVHFSDYFIVLIFVVMFLGIFEWFDTFVLKKVDTIKEIKEGNIAYAIFLLTLAVVILAGAITVG